LDGALWRWSLMNVLITGVDGMLWWRSSALSVVVCLAPHVSWTFIWYFIYAVRLIKHYDIIVTAQHAQYLAGEGWQFYGMGPSGGFECEEWSQLAIENGWNSQTVTIQNQTEVLLGDLLFQGFKSVIIQTFTLAIWESEWHPHIKHDVWCHSFTILFTWVKDTMLDHRH
jgi:hypothetical protein